MDNIIRLGLLVIVFFVWLVIMFAMYIINGISGSGKWLALILTLMSGFVALLIIRGKSPSSDNNVKNDG